MTEIAMVPTEGVSKLWPSVEGMISRSLERMPGRYHVIDFYVRAWQGEVALWVAFEKENIEIKGAWMTRIYEVPMGKIMAIEWLGGADIHSWEEKAIETMEEYARTVGCSRMEASGREGWTPFAKKHGFEKRAVIYDKEL